MRREALLKQSHRSLRGMLQVLLIRELLLSDLHDVLRQLHVCVQAVDHYRHRALSTLNVVRQPLHSLAIVREVRRVEIYRAPPP